LPAREREAWKLPHEGFHRPVDGQLLGAASSPTRFADTAHGTIVRSRECAANARHRFLIGLSGLRQTTRKQSSRQHQGDSIRPARGIESTLASWVASYRALRVVCRNPDSPI
jgi:hypothetical protein